MLTMFCMRDSSPLNRVILGKNWEKLRLILWTSFWKLVVVGALSHR